MADYTKNELHEILRPIFEKWGIKLAYFFGSAYRRATGPLSDIDLAILWPRIVNAPMLKSLELQQEIKDKLAEERFEIGCLNGQNLSFCYIVISTGACIYGQETDRVAYETEILSQYLDFNYLAEEYNRAFDQRIKGGQ
jgi:predicted nucleotidyltransferase